MSEPIRIANCSGFYGDRLSAAQEMVSGGPIDVLTGDWLAELTLLILARNRQRDPSMGYAKTFVTQMSEVMKACIDDGIKVVSNAGGLAPEACAEAVAAVAGRLGLSPRIAWVSGDDLLPRWDELISAGASFAHLDTGRPLGDRRVLTANAYLGGWGIAEALAQGADIVITGRVTDAALVVGPAAWHHRWGRDDWDALAGAVVAGHVIECGAQATGGNYAFFGEVPGLDHVGFPIAEVAEDGSSVITKHPGHGGLVSEGTVTAQLLYEIAGPAYPNPDVTARFDSIALESLGPDRVGISGVRGEPPPSTTKVAINYEGGWKTTTAVVLTGLDIEAKAAAFEQALWSSIPGGREAFEEVETVLLRREHADPESNEAAMTELRITVRAAVEADVGRALTARITELGLASYPGFFGGTTTTTAYGVYWPALLPTELVANEVHLDGRRTVVAPVLPGAPMAAARPETTPAARPATGGRAGPTRRAPLGRIVGARSGDKGGNANVGLWVRTDAGYAWLVDTLTIDRLRELLPETRTLPVERHLFANLRAVNFVVIGLLGEGVASSSRVDAQAKGLGEYLRAKMVEIPAALVDRDH